MFTHRLLQSISTSTIIATITLLWSMTPSHPSHEAWPLDPKQPTISRSSLSLPGLTTLGVRISHKTFVPTNLSHPWSTNKTSKLERTQQSIPFFSKLTQPNQEIRRFIIIWRWEWLTMLRGTILAMGRQLGLHARTVQLQELFPFSIRFADLKPLKLQRLKCKRWMGMCSRLIRKGSLVRTK